MDNLWMADHFSGIKKFKMRQIMSREKLTVGSEKCFFPDATGQRGIAALRKYSKVEICTFPCTKQNRGQNGSCQNGT